MPARGAARGLLHQPGPHALMPLGLAGAVRGAWSPLLGTCPTSAARGVLMSQCEGPALGDEAMGSRASSGLPWGFCVPHRVSLHSGTKLLPLSALRFHHCDPGSTSRPPGALHALLLFLTEAEGAALPGIRVGARWAPGSFLVAASTPERTAQCFCSTHIAATCRAGGAGPLPPVQEPLACPNLPPSERASPLAAPGWLLHGRGGGRAVPGAVPSSVHSTPAGPAATAVL